MIPKIVLKSQLEEEILKLNVPPVDAVHIGEFKTKNLFAFFSWKKFDPQLTLAAFGDFKLPGMIKNSYVQLCDPKVPLPLDNSLILPGFCNTLCEEQGKPCQKCALGNTAARYGIMSGAKKIQLLTGKVIKSKKRSTKGKGVKSKVQENKPTKVAEQVIYKPMTVTAVTISMNEALNYLVKEVEATKEDVATKKKLSGILKQVFIKEYPEVDIEMYGSLAR